MSQHIKIGISVGDINGIGPEIIIKAFADKRVLSNVTPIIYGSKKIFTEHLNLLELNNVTINYISSTQEASKKQVNVLQVWEDNFTLNPGEFSKIGGEYAYKSLKAATTDLASNKVDVLVTAPINKENIQSSGFDFPGHTEYLAKLSNVDEALMLMCGEDLRVGVVTGHIPLNSVSSALSEELVLNKIGQMNNSLVKDFMISKPKIGVLGLNPHAGENGLLGDEENKILIPAIRKAKSMGILAYGPFPADGFFGSSTFREFDGVLAMYHDQGLIPFKSMTFGSGVNFTAGLPIVRTSPDHGVAYDLVGKNKASASSFRNAVYMARDIYNNRELYKEIHSNPLPVGKPTNQKIK
jgi:4-hydroxythreonine-4-phosphate dehydrogenase